MRPFFKSAATIFVLFGLVVVSCHTEAPNPNDTAPVNSASNQALLDVKKNGSLSLSTLYPDKYKAVRTVPSGDYWAGLDYIFYDHWEVCSNQSGYRSPTTVQVRNTNSYQMDNVYLYLYIQSNMSLVSNSQSQGSLSYDYTYSGAHSVYRWDIGTLSPNQTVILQVGTQFAASAGVEGVLGLFLYPTDTMYFCQSQRTLINIINDKLGLRCGGSPPSYPNCY